MIPQQEALSIFVVLWDPSSPLDEDDSVYGPVSVHTSRAEAEEFINGRPGFEIQEHRFGVDLHQVADDLGFRYWTGISPIEQRSKWSVVRHLDIDCFYVEASPIIPTGAEMFRELSHDQFEALVYADSADAAIARATAYFGADRFTDTCGHDWCST